MISGPNHPNGEPAGPPLTLPDGREVWSMRLNELRRALAAVMPNLDPHAGKMDLIAAYERHLASTKPTEKKWPT